MFVGTRSFLHAPKDRLSYIIYATPASNSTKISIGITSQYQEFQDVFEKKNVDTLPEHHPYDCSIDLQERTQLPFGPIYSLLQNKLLEFKEYIEKNLVENFIRHSKSPIRALILFVKKKDGSL